MKKDKLLIGTIIVSIIVLISGATYAYWTWSTSGSQETSVEFTLGNNTSDTFSCSADGGGDITPSGSITIVPSTCTNAAHVIKRAITTKTTINTSVIGDPVYLNMWLNINSINSYLTGITNFKYALTNTSANCATDVVTQGNFSGKAAGGTVNLLTNISNTAATTNKTYYLWIWLDSEETALPPSGTADNTHLFSFSISGSCSTHAS